MRYLTGFHAIEELIKAGKAKGPLLVSNAGPRARAVMELAVEKKIPVNRTGEHEMDRIARGHRGIALAVEGDEESAETTVKAFLADLEEGSDEIVVVLDGITDPHNFGAILRSCDQFGVSLVVVPNRRSARDTETVSKTSAGASAWMPIATVPNLSRAVEELKEAGFWVFGADMGGEEAADLDLKGRVAIVMGSEGEGISRLLREHCDRIAAIPSRGRVDSLNVSVAAGILLYETNRQRRPAAKGKKEKA